MTAVQFEKLQEPHTLIYVNPRTPWISRAPWANILLAFSRFRDVAARYLSRICQGKVSFFHANLAFRILNHAVTFCVIYIYIYLVYFYSFSFLQGYNPDLSRLSMHSYRFTLRRDITLPFYRIISIHN